MENKPLTKDKTIEFIQKELLLKLGELLPYLDNDEVFRDATECVFSNSILRVDNNTLCETIEMFR